MTQATPSARVSTFRPSWQEPLPRATPWTAAARFWTNAIRFTGRASRAEYWWSILFLTLVAGGLLWRAGTVITALNSTAVCGISYGCAPVTSLPAYRDYTSTGILIAVVAVVLLLPTLALTSRRLRDSNFSSHFLWLALLLGIGTLALLGLALAPARPSTP